MLLCGSFCLALATPITSFQIELSQQILFLTIFVSIRRYLYIFLFGRIFASGQTGFLKEILKVENKRCDNVLL